MTDDRLPTALWVDAHLHTLTASGLAFYIINKGEYNSGIVLLNLANTKGMCRLLIQQRNFETNEMGWISALSQETVEEQEADRYIQRALKRDPDLWVIEVEDPEMQNPFEGKIL
ncbi:MAG: DUF1491 family protein [Alphaproteobacteria bacterium]|nr:DUF1491 family protein [Alphaproteobacteria bacterium]